MKKLSRKLVLVALAALASVSITGSVEAKKKRGYPSVISLDKPDLDLAISGRVREEFFYLDKVSSLRDNYNDTYHFWRNKVNLGLYLEHGKQEYGEPAVEAKVRLTAFNYWDNATKYTPIIEEANYLEYKEFRKKSLQLEDSPAHTGIVPLLYQEEAWLAMNFDVFWKKLAPMPTTLKVGYFPYMVGRGVSLGDYYDGGIEYMGWEPKGNAGNASQAPAGLLLDIEFSDKYNLELYYSKRSAVTTSPRQTRAPIKAIRLDVPFEAKDPLAIERGTQNDGSIFSAKLDIDYTLGKSKFHLEPYIVYADTPEQTIEMTDDASSKLGTIGAMLEIKGKGDLPKYVFNMEGAVQFGEQELYAIDRNHQVVDIEEGQLLDKWSHIWYKSWNAAAPVSVTKDVEEVVYMRHNRGLEQQGAQIRDKNGALISWTGPLEPYNADLPFGKLRRFRPGYKLKYRGKMLMADFGMYLFKKPLTKLSLAAGYFSGDDYPYNTEVDKNYNGFLPLRDSNYLGHSVNSFAMLYARKIPRPKNVAEHKAYAFNDDSTVTNLKYIGAGVMMHPFWHPKKMIIMANVLGFWEDKAPYMWDKTKTRDVAGENAGDPYAPYYGGVYDGLQKKLGFVGAQTTKRASSFLGTEVNATIVWNVLESLQLVGIFAAYFPGQLYKDIEAQPNRNTRRFTSSGQALYEGLGSKAVIGGNLRMTYKF